MFQVREAFHSWILKINIWNKKFNETYDTKRVRNLVKQLEVGHIKKLWIGMEID
jgi:hypothetical protein